MIGHKLPNKTKSAIVAEPKLFHQLNNPDVPPKERNPGVNLCTQKLTNQHCHEQTRHDP
jgi:hypothetical protein